MPKTKIKKTKPMPKPIKKIMKPKKPKAPKNALMGAMPVDKMMDSKKY